MRAWLFLFCLLPVHGTEFRDCGLESGKRYGIREGALVGDDIVVFDWADCYIPEGVVLSVGVVDVDPKPTRIRLDITPPCRGVPGWEAAALPKARAYAAKLGVPEDGVSVNRLACSAAPHIDAVVIEVH